MLPALSLLTIGESPNVEIQKRNVTSFYARWIDACGGIDNLPKFKQWGNRSAKRVFRELVNRSENDRFSAGQYLGSYTATDVDVMLAKKTYSIEHIVPRSYVNGRRGGRAEADFFGWDLVTRSSNSKRSNLPLVLWEDTSLPLGRVLIEGEMHYNPLEEHKPRLARRWIYIRCTYVFIDDINTPSNLQKKHILKILEVAKIQNPNQRYAEQRLHGFLVDYCKSEYKVNWKNPLNDKETAHELLNDPEITHILSGW